MDNKEEVQVKEEKLGKRYAPEEPINPPKRIRKKIVTKPPPQDSQRFSFQEKVDLYNGLIQHGSSHLSLLKSFVPGKSEEDIKKFIENCKRMARHDLMEGKKKAHIDEWLDYLGANLGEDKEKRYDLHRTMKYIALFEPRTPKTGSMLSESYKLISDCLKGESPKHLDPITSLFLYEELQRLVRIFKSQNSDSEKKFINARFKKPVVCYRGKKTQVEEGVSGGRSKISNPLKIPDFLLELKK